MKQKIIRNTSKEEIDDSTLMDMIIELMVAGYFTSASAATSALRLLSQHPDVFRSSEHELAAFGLLNADLTMPCELPQVDRNMIGRMKLLDNVVRETLRVRPPVLGGFRKAIKTFQVGVGSLQKFIYL